MGWWEVGDTENVIGDRPLDLLGNAALAIVAEYERELGRRPTKAEWEALLHAVLGAEGDEPHYFDHGCVERVQLDMKERSK
jgi:hypothetical protein